jgi:outer membrane protein OmpA-like peptidoglycan-associated protein
MRAWGLLVLLCLGPTLANLSAQEGQTVRVTHKFDLKRWVNNDYQGLVHGYLTGAWKLSPAEAGWTDVEARYELASESRKDNALTEKPISAESFSRFRISPQGTMTDFRGDGVPLYRNFPAPLPADSVPGSSWTGSGELVEDFLGTGHPTRIPILISYQWVGPGEFLGTPVVQIKTQYALRYKSGDDPDGDPTLAKAEGKHVGVVSYDQTNHRVVFIRETAQETFTSTTGTTLGSDGFILTFLENVPTLGTAAVVTSLNQALRSDPSLSKASSGTPDVRIEADPRGVKVTLDNLQFVADQTILLPGEDERLSGIANLLKTVPGRNLLVVGHTAAAGTTESQDKLSVDRAMAIVEKLKGAGIPAQRLLYEGRGGRDPVATNETERGRAQNRRVEILILDQ